MPVLDQVQHNGSGIRFSYSLETKLDSGVRRNEFIGYNKINNLKELLTVKIIRINK